MSTDDDTIPTAKVAQLRLSISNLFDEFGSADEGLAIVINVSLSLLGVAVVLLTTGWLQWLGGVWALVNILPVVEWVLRG